MFLVSADICYVVGKHQSRMIFPQKNNFFQIHSYHTVIEIFHQKLTPTPTSHMPPNLAFVDENDERFSSSRGRNRKTGREWILDITGCLI